MFNGRDPVHVFGHQSDSFQNHISLKFCEDDMTPFCMISMNSFWLVPFLVAKWGFTTTFYSSEVPEWAGTTEPARPRTRWGPPCPSPSHCRLLSTIFLFTKSFTLKDSEDIFDRPNFLIFKRHHQFRNS